MTDQQARTALRRQTYGTGDLSALSIFAGGFINFGYWRDLPTDGPISIDQRVASQQALYELVLDTLAISARDRVLEIGCGRGLGSALALRRGPARVVGIDLMPEQVARARATTADLTGRLAFQQGSASAIPFPDHAFDCVLSVEAAQHFEDLRGFAGESFRVLAPGGRLALVSFFASGEDSGAELAKLLETFATGLDLAHPIDALLADLRAAGFAEVRAESIGEHVWRGFGRWIEQGEYRDSWGRNWIPATERGLVDYYLVAAHRPVEAKF